MEKKETNRLQIKVIKCFTLTKLQPQASGINKLYSPVWIFVYIKIIIDF